MTDDAGRGHSTAYESIVRDLGEDEDDVVGLLAYAYYKTDKRALAIENRLNAEQLADHHKTLTPRLIDQYRDNALRRLEGYANAVVERVEPEIRETTRTDTIEIAERKIIARIDERTKGGFTVLWNVIAWLITLAITVLVLVSTGAVTINIGG